MKVDKYSESLLTEMYKDGMIPLSVIESYHIRRKIDSLPVSKLSVKVRLIALETRKSTRTIYRAYARFDL